MTTAYYDSRGQRIALGKQLGKGGEGAVFETCNGQNLVAKVYHQAIVPEKADKLNRMVRLRSDRLLNIAAWPVDTLHNTTSGGSVKGLLLPRVQGKAVHNLYGPKSRLTHFPAADWRFLVWTAANAARAFSVIHEHGHVIGDVNYGNLFVTEQATVTLIDCDSFQIMSEGQAFLCEVGVDMYTPPELQGSRFRDITRTTNHDAFGLAILIFQLLFMGRHPFSGGYLGTGDMPIPKAIAEFRFAYGSKASERQMVSPPATLPLEAASAYIALLFERAFAREGMTTSGRPKPQDWVLALEALAKTLKPCTQHSGHYFLNGLPSCPWCLMESRSGSVYFSLAFAGAGQNQKSFDIRSFWLQVEQIPSPDPAPILPVLGSFAAGPSLNAVTQGKTFRLGIGKVISLMGLNPKRNQARQEVKRTLQEAQVQWTALTERWQKEADSKSFYDKRKELQFRISDYEKLPDLKQRKRQQLEVNLRASQLFKFLDTYKIWWADISGIGEGRKVTLQSYGIETAADIVETTILSIPGFGPSLTGNLLRWRYSIESKFIFDSTKGVDPADYIAIDRDINQMRQKLERELHTGQTQLATIGQQIKMKREILLKSIEQQLKVITQAEADLKVL